VYFALNQALFGKKRTSSLTLSGLMLSMDPNQAHFAKFLAKQGGFLRFATRFPAHR